MLEQKLKRSKFMQYITPTKLSFKIPLIYFIVILITFVLSYTVLTKISSDSAQQKINQVSLQTITSIQTNVNFMIENVDNYSKMIFSDNNLQNLLRQGDVYSNLQAQAKVSQYLYNLIQAEPVIDSVYIFDNSGNSFSVGSQTPPTFSKKNVKEASWYKEAVSNNGKYILRLNGSGAFSPNSKENFVSFIRLIRDIDNTSTLGIMVINIPESAFVQSYSNVVNDNSLQIVILNEDNQIIVPDSSDDKSVALFKEILLKNEGSILEKFAEKKAGYLTSKSDSQKYIVSYLSDENFGWKYVSVMPNGIIRYENKSLVLLMLLLLIVNAIIFFVSSLIISRSIINPIHLLLQSMKNAQNGDFEEVKTKPNSYEFEKLFVGYNKMIGQIDQLLKRVIDEQRTIRKAELKTLQAQIKPHFLYNTLDSINSLALSGLNNQVCDMVDALGSYYRMSVSKGRDVITIGEEVEMVRNYLKIQKVRYQDMFDVEYDVEDDCCGYPILKQVLQPLVENSLYHGIRKKGTNGRILVSAHSTDKTVEITISDDGIGMSKEEIDQILEMEKDEKSKSFGLWGTMERIRIFYEDKNCFTIESIPGEGTKITLFIPKGEDTAWSN